MIRTATTLSFLLVLVACGEPAEEVTEPDAMPAVGVVDLADGVYDLTWTCEKGCVYPAPFVNADTLEVDGDLAIFTRTNAPESERQKRTMVREGTCGRINGLDGGDTATAPVDLCAGLAAIGGTVRWERTVNPMAELVYQIAATPR